MMKHLATQHKGSPATSANAMAPPKEDLQLTPMKDLTFKLLPYLYMSLVEVVPPSLIGPKIWVYGKNFVGGNINFKLTERDITRLKGEEEGYLTKTAPNRLFLRFRKFDKEGESSDDHWPPELIVHLNKCRVSFTKELHRNAVGLKPINLTPYINHSPEADNTLTIKWLDTKMRYACMIQLAGGLPSESFADLIYAYPTLSYDEAIKRINEVLKSQGEEGIATTSFKVSALCPLTKVRMANPARGQNCDHMQCFEAHSYVLMNLEHPNWKCPICNKTIRFYELFLDMHQWCIIEQTEGNTYSFTENGIWKSGEEIPHDTPNCNKNTEPTTIDIKEATSASSDQGVTQGKKRKVECLDVI